MITLIESHCRVCSAMFPSVNLKENKRNLETTRTLYKYILLMRLSDYRAVELAIGSWSRITTPLPRKRPFHWISHEGRQGNLKNLKNVTNYRCLLIVPAAIWLKYCRYIVKPYTINQSFESVWKDLTLLKKQEEYS